MDRFPRSREEAPHADSTGDTRSASPIPPGPIPPPDLEIRVTVEMRGGETFLTYLLHSSSDRQSGFHYQTIHGKPLKTRPQDYHTALLEEIERLNVGKHKDGSLVLGEEVPIDLAALGRKLYRELFPPEMRAAYRTFRKNVTTLLITSDEPWIPWELVKPYEDDAGELIDDDFLCVRFQLTRWLSGGSGPATVIGIKDLTCVEAGRAVKGSRLPNAELELRWLQNLAGRYPGIADRSLPQASYPQVKQRLEEGGADLLHFVGHGRFESGDPDQSSFYLADGRPLRPLDLHGEIQTRTKRRRPLVFLNACQVGRQSFSLTGLGGWAPRWVKGCGCGAFIAPLWPVDDRLAHVFATTFYKVLEDGGTFGDAAQTARRQVRNLDPSKPTWLAYAVYAHPNGRLLLGRRPPPAIDGTRGEATGYENAETATAGGPEVSHAGDRSGHMPGYAPLTAGRVGRILKSRKLRFLAAVLVVLIVSWTPKLYQPDLGSMPVHPAIDEEPDAPISETNAKPIPIAEGRVQLRIQAASTSPLSTATLQKELSRGIEERLGSGWDPGSGPSASCLVALDFGAAAVSQPDEMTSCAFEVGYRLIIGGETVDEDLLNEIKKAFNQRTACVNAVRTIGGRVGNRVLDLCDQSDK